MNYVTPLLPCLECRDPASVSYTDIYSHSMKCEKCGHELPVKEWNRLYCEQLEKAALEVARSPVDKPGRAT